ncbi:unnamed protein product [Absidia cylindrospora]
MSMIFFTFSTLKTVDDHCGYYLPWNPFQFLFGNNVKYHDIHHQAWASKPTSLSHSSPSGTSYWALK